MTPADFDRLVDTFATFHQRFAPLFGRIEAQRRSEQYLRGLLVQQADRRNAENLAEAIPEATPRALQRFLSEAPWATTPLIDALQTYLAEFLADPDGVFVLDETGFPKQGRHSVGVTRQYSGTLGKIGNCQVGVFLAYVAPRGHALVDHRLYLPRAWTDDAARCRAAGVPPEVAFQTKAELGLVMLRQARERRQLPGRWLTADEHYGQVPSFRDALDAEGWWYVLEVPTAVWVFAEQVASAVPATGRGRPARHRRRVAGAADPRRITEVVADLPTAAWHTLTVADGAQGPRTYQFAAQRVWESRSEGRDHLPGRACWLVARRNLDGSELKYLLSNAPDETPLRTLATVSAMRWSIETEFETAKGDLGLDEYEVRAWPGWQHHITLVLLAGAFLLTVQQEWGKNHARPHASAGQPGAARPAAPPGLDTQRPVAVAHRDTSPQPARQTLPYPTSPA
jgi:SRSO17 transposase